jgi:pimeloyl-ACP methyl ester carboxylesterase
MAGYLYDLAQLVHQQRLAPVTLIAHSLGGNIALRHAGIYPDALVKLVAIEGLGPSPRILAERAKETIVGRMRKWVDEQRGLAGRLPRRYASIEDAFRRMQEANPHLTPEMARHLTLHGTRRHEDGSYTWKFDNYVRLHSPYEFNSEDAREIWNQIRQPVLLVRGDESWATDPEQDGRASAFHNYCSVQIGNAGHWVHHDQLYAFLDVLRGFL